MGRFVTLVEVGPRDGLQNEPTILPTEAKIAFIERAIDHPQAPMAELSQLKEQQSLGEGRNDVLVHWISVAPSLT